ncbi:MAG: trehalose-phosphatase [Candidatus Omnitrophica bacterium]|nr:trehalose-phosphatase [Candidatus Omnitrophota bacterium]MDE2221610.1 trehalose-phosphatase [Candidatus Omnitrophota bacterium]
MKYILDAFGSLKTQIMGKPLFLFLDYDGTLTPLADHPDKAVLNQSTRKLLEKLAADDLINISIVSGRALWDIRNRVALQDVSYIGNHGLEMNGPGFNFQGFDLYPVREIIEYLKWEINRELVFFKGAFIEDKGIALSVHYRKLKEEETAIFKVFLDNLTSEFLFREQIRVFEGEKVFEIRPPVFWDKGQAMQWMLEQYQYDYAAPIPFYVGSSSADEEAFRQLKGKGVTVRVGRERTSLADYYLTDQKQVTVLLKRLLNLKKRG